METLKQYPDWAEHPKQEYDHTPVLWSSCDGEHKLKARNILRATQPVPQMLLPNGHAVFCKLAKSTDATFYYKAVIFDKNWLIARCKSEMLNPLGLESLEQLAKVLSDDL